MKNRSEISNPEPKNYFVIAEKKIDNQDITIINISQEELLKPLCMSISLTNDTDFALAELNALHIILEGVGHNLDGPAWPIIIKAITTLSGAEYPSDVDRTISSWSSCSSLAFRCLKLIVDDLLDHLFNNDDLDKDSKNNKIAIHEALLDCCAAFGSSKHDVNTSLTATGMLWTIADQDATPSFLDHVLSKLAYLACDDRSEVRNCSLNTLYSCIVGLGHQFTHEQWKSCFEKTIFGVLDSTFSNDQIHAIDNKSPTGKKDNGTRYSVTVHHTRDSVIKQWATTHVLALKGLERVLRQFFTQLLSTSSPISNTEQDKQQKSWFDLCWKGFIHLAYKCASQFGGREILELRLAGVDILVLCAQLSCRDGIGAAVPPIRVGTNMQVVNGALRNVSSTTSQVKSNNPPANAILVDDTCERTLLLEHKQRLFISTFEVLEHFTKELHEEEVDSDENQLFVDSARLQVLNKLSNGFAQLYDCCKKFELLPPSFVVRCSNDNNFFLNENYESRFVQMVHSVTILAFPDSKNKYLTEAQRVSLELLSNMASHSSSNAFEKLAFLGGKYFAWFLSLKDDEKSSQELIEQEAAKAVSEAFVKENVPDFVKVSVLSMILKKSYSELSEKWPDKMKTNEVKLSHPSYSNDDGSFSSDEFEECDSYDFIVPIFTGGLKSASMLDLEFFSNSVDKCLENGSNHGISEMLNSLWSRVLSMLFVILCPVSNTFTPHTDHILQILICCISFAPTRVYEKLGNALFHGCKKSFEIAKIHSFYSNSPSLNVSYSDEPCRDALRVFEACFVGLTQCGAESESLKQVIKASFSRVLDDFDRPSNMRIKSYTSNLDELSKLMKDDNRGSNRLTFAEAGIVHEKLLVDVDIEVAISICDVLSDSSIKLLDATLALFPLLCRLVNADNDRLSSKAGLVLAGLDLGGIIEKANKETIEARTRAINAEKRNEVLLNEILQLRAQNEALKKDQ